MWLNGPWDEVIWKWINTADQKINKAGTCWQRQLYGDISQISLPWFIITHNSLALSLLTSRMVTSCFVAVRLFVVSSVKNLGWRHLSCFVNGLRLYNWRIFGQNRKQKRQQESWWWCKLHSRWCFRLALDINTSVGESSNFPFSTLLVNVKLKLVKIRVRSGNIFMI